MKNSHTVRLDWDAPIDGLNCQPGMFYSLLEKLCYDVDSSFSLKVLTLLRNEPNDDKLLDLNVRPIDYCDQKAYYADVQVLALIKKNPSLNVSVSPERQGMLDFIDAELTCRSTNDEYRARGRMFTNPTCAAIIHSARQKIASVLGRVPTVHQSAMQFGPGSSRSVKKYTSAFHKLKGRLDVTSECIPRAIELFNCHPTWCHALGVASSDDAGILDLFNVVEGSELSFVPKTAKTVRPICIEPTINGVIQKMYGSDIRAKLKRAAWVDLKHAQPRHRRLARQSSIDDSLATIDLSKASDTISSLFVMDMLPFPWYQALNECRSHYYHIQGKDYRFSKFSSMGNGYTFELESLLFLSLAKACEEYLGLPRKASCYGDDILISPKAADLLISVLDICGFATNVQKSYVNGPFKESCGGDYWDGTPVRPFYLKDDLSPRVLTLLRNNLERTGYRYEFPKLFRHTESILRSLKFLNFGPDNGTDGHCVTYGFPKGRRYVTYVDRYIGKFLNKKHPLWLSFSLYRMSELSRDNLGFVRVAEQCLGFRPYRSPNWARRKATHNFGCSLTDVKAHLPELSGQ